MRTLAVAVLVAGAMLAVPHARAQNFYVGPQDVDQVLELFSSLSAGGTFHTADLHGILGLDVGLRGVAVFVPDEYKALRQGPFENVDFVGLPYVHASVGLPFRLEAMGRFFHYPLGEEPTRGGVTLAGVGLKYGLLQGPLLPKVALMVAYHAFFVPEEYSFGTVSTLSLKAVISKGVPFITFYSGVGVDRTSLELDYQGVTGSYASTNLHGNVGVTIRPLPLVYANIDYMFAEEFAGFNVGVGVTIR
ncbi:MAG: hypothetical protein ONB30_00040 [candidate division KSB1 bacterium]|nr:hypothetical protein [candidate division KSB1 bacterium]